MSFSETTTKAKAAAEAENLKKGNSLDAQTNLTAFGPRKT
jgi:hypothetical protein